MTISISDVISSHLKNFQKSLYTSLPAKVVEVTSDNPLTVTVQPLVADFRRDGGVTLPPTIYGVPVLHPSGGGAHITLPISVDDTVLVVFCMRDISTWLSDDGKGKTANTYSMHDQSDAIAITGLFADQSSGKTVTPNDRVKISYGESTVEIEQENITINTTKEVHLGSGVVESAVLGESLKSYIDGHTHAYFNQGVPNDTSAPATTGTAFSGLSVPTPLPDSVLSTKVKVE